MVAARADLLGRRPPRPGRRRRGRSRGGAGRPAGPGGRRRRRHRLLPGRRARRACPATTGWPWTWPRRRPGGPPGPIPGPARSSPTSGAGCRWPTAAPTWSSTSSPRATAPSSAGCCAPAAPCWWSPRARTTWPSWSARSGCSGSTRPRANGSTAASAGISLVAEQRYGYPLDLRRDDAARFVAMGPSAWHADPAGLAAALADWAEPVRVTVSVSLRAGHPRPRCALTDRPGGGCRSADRSGWAVVFPPWLVGPVGWVVAVAAGVLATGPLFARLADSGVPRDVESVAAYDVISAGNDSAGTIVGVVDRVDPAATRSATRWPRPQRACPRGRCPVGRAAGRRRTRAGRLGHPDQAGPIRAGPDGRRHLRRAARADRPLPPGATVEVGGGPVLSLQTRQAVRQDLQRAEYSSLPITLIVLVLVFGGLVAAGLPALPPPSRWPPRWA